MSVTLSDYASGPWERSHEAITVAAGAINGGCPQAKRTLWHYTGNLLGGD